MAETHIRISYDQWSSEGARRYGDDRMAWRFVCPSCGHVATPDDWQKAGASEGAIAFSCVGRWSGVNKQAFAREGNGPCNYAGGGLFRINPVLIDRDGREHSVFDFADEPLVATQEDA